MLQFRLKVLYPCNNFEKITADVNKCLGMYEDDSKFNDDVLYKIFTTEKKKKLYFYHHVINHNSVVCPFCCPQSVCRIRTSWTSTIWTKFTVRLRWCSPWPCSPGTRTDWSGSCAQCSSGNARNAASCICTTRCCGGERRFFGTWSSRWRNWPARISCRSVKAVSCTGGTPVPVRSPKVFLGFPVEPTRSWRSRILSSTHRRDQGGRRA